MIATDQFRHIDGAHNHLSPVNIYAAPTLLLLHALEYSHFEHSYLKMFHLFTPPNGANAQRSTGPKTEVGKAASSHNPLPRQAPGGEG